MAINLPDSEILFRTWATSQSVITDIVSTRIATRLPSNATLPFAVVDLVDSGPENLDSAGIWVAFFNINCFAGKYGSDGNKATPDFANAFALSNDFVRCAFDQTPKKYTITGTDGIIYGFNPVSGPSRMEDTDRNLARYTVNVGMYYGEAT